MSRSIMALLSDRVSVLILCSFVACIHGMQEVKIDQLGREATIHCVEEEPDTTPTLIHWVLPNMHILLPTYDNTSIDSLYLLNDGDLHIGKVSLDHLGSYLCYFEYKGEAEYSRTELRLPELWEVYRMNVIIGCSAAAVVLVVFAASCIVYNLRYERKLEEADSHILNGYENRSFSHSSYDSNIKKEVPSMYDQVEIANYEPGHAEGATKM